MTKLNDNLKDRLLILESNKLTNKQLDNIRDITDIKEQVKNIDGNISNINKIYDVTSYCIKEIFMHNIDLIRTFTFENNINEILISQFEIDQREFIIDDIFDFFSSITIQFTNFKTSWYVLKMRIDILDQD